MGVPTQHAAELPASPGGPQWLDIRVVYVRVSAPAVSNAQAPECLLLRCAPRDIRSELEMNGARIPPSEPATLTLRLDRVDEDSSEAMYVSTDKLRLSSSLPFAIFHQEEQLMEGLVSCRDGLQHWTSSADNQQQQQVTPSLDWHADTRHHGGELQNGKEWGMKCTCTVSPNWPGFAIKSLQDFTTGQPVQPSLEVCVVGKCNGASTVLTEQMQLSLRKRSQWKGGLDVIPEYGEAAKGPLSSQGLGSGERSFQHQQLIEFDGKTQYSQGQRAGEDDHQLQGQGGEGPAFLEGLWPTQAGLNGLYGDADENGEMTWFNAGVRVGVGIGLGMCIGMGIGVGLIVKTYQATTRPFRGGRL